MSETTKKEPLKLTFAKKEKFKGTIKSDFMTTAELARMINPIFKSVFKDYNGIVIKPCENAGIMNEMPVILELDFIPGSDNGEGSIPAFVNIGSDDNTKNIGISSLALSALQYNKIASSTEAFQITQDAVDILYDYIGGPAGRMLKNSVMSFMKSSFVIELVDDRRNIWGKDTRIIHSLVTSCIDINRLISGIMEDKDETGSRYYYQVTPVKPIASVNSSSNVSTNYLYQITQFSKKEMERVMSSIGAVSSAISTIPVNQA